MADDTTTTAKEKKSQTPKKKRGFFKGVKSEFKKISWPSRDTVVKESAAVIVISVVLGVLITIIDTILEYGLNFIIGL